MSASIPALKHLFSFNVKCTTFLSASPMQNAVNLLVQVLEREPYNLVSIKRKPVKEGAERKAQTKENWFKNIN